MGNTQSTILLKPKVGIAAWAVDNGRVLMGRRRGFHGKDTWACPGGHLEFGEDPIKSACRELQEETNLLAEEIEFACWTNDIFKEENQHYLTLHMIVTKHTQELILMEPDKCSEWKWLFIDEIPEELFIPAKHFIETGILQKYLEASKKETIS